MTKSSRLAERRLLDLTNIRPYGDPLCTAVHTNIHGERVQSAITKTSGKLGPSHHRNGAWGRLKGQDSINIDQASKNAATVQLQCTWLHKQPPLSWCGIFAWNFCLSCPSKRSQVPLRCCRLLTQVLTRFAANVTGTAHDESTLGKHNRCFALFCQISPSRWPQESLGHGRWHDDKENLPQTRFTKKVATSHSCRPWPIVLLKVAYYASSSARNYANLCQNSQIMLGISEIMLTKWRRFCTYWRAITTPNDDVFQINCSCKYFVLLQFVSALSCLT